VNVFLSYAVAPLDMPFATRLQAVAAAYDISILLPDRTQPIHDGLPAETQTKIQSSDAVIALVTVTASPNLIALVNAELRAAAQLDVPVIALIEQGIHIEAAHQTHAVYFDRFLPTAHEQQLVVALSKIQQRKQSQDSLSALGWIAGIALGLIALSEIIGDPE
jgi:hypothetical protein